MPAAAPSRREALLGSLAAAAAALQLPGVAPAWAEGPAATSGGMAHFSNATLAYSFDYPVTTASGAPLQLVLTRPPEKVCDGFHGARC